MKTYSHPTSAQLFERAARVIPSGIPGHFGPAPLVPPSAYPLFTDHAQGARFWDVDGNEHIDYMCSYGPIVLGHHHPVVDEAAAAQRAKGNCLPTAAPIMIELAEYLTQTIAGMSWAFFAKNGGDVTAMSLMLAREATGRKKVVLIKGCYHGVAPWMQAPGHHGQIEEDYRNVVRIGWNDVEALERVIRENPNQIAAFMATPYHHPTFTDSEMPAPGYWKRIESICRREGIVLIVDDVRCGFRLDMRGSHAYFGFQPDVVCFCKAIANGYPISAMLGTDAMRPPVGRLFYTGSYWYQAEPMAAALANLKELARINGPQLMLDTGRRLLSEMVDIARGYGYNLRVTGAPSMPFLRLTDDETNTLHEEWCGECSKRGAYFTPHHNWFISCAHGEEEVKRTLEIADDAFQAMRARRRG